MPFSWDDMPYTNFHELNLDWFINKFKEIFEEWESLYNQLTTWKDTTDAELEAWKTAREADIESWETATLAALDAWKTATETDIGTWETATIAALDTWKTAAEAAFEAIRVQAAASATAAAGSATDAETAKTAALAAQTAAETAAASVTASAEQIATNSADISELKTQLIANGAGFNYAVLDDGYVLSEKFLNRKGIDSNTGSYSDSTTRLSTGLIPVIEDITKIDIVLGQNVGLRRIFKYNEDMSFIESGSWSPYTMSTIAGWTGYIAISFAKTNMDEALTIDEFDATIEFTQTGNHWGNMTLISSGTDVNTLQTQGVYIFGTNSTNANMPWAKGKRTIIVYEYTRNYIPQIAINYDTGDIATRVFHDNIWDDWALNENQMMLKLATLNADTNSFTTPGSYIMGRTDAHANIPWSSGKRMLLVYKYSDTYIVQLAFNIDTGESAFRAYADGSWSAWSINPSESNDNTLMASNFNPVYSRRLMFTKGKIWEKNWNTAEAFTAAGKDPMCWGISADVRKTSDGYYVCFHDATLDAQTDGSGSVESKTWAELQEVNVLTGVWNGSAWVAQSDGLTGKIPLLSTFLDICKKYGKVAIVETKAAGSDAVATLANADYNAIMDMVENRGMIGCFAWITTDSGAIYLNNNHTKCYKFIIKESTITDDYIAQWAGDKNLIFAAHNSVLSTTITNKIHKTGHFVAGYTPRTQPQSEYEAMSEKGVDLIFTYREPPADFQS